MTGTEPSLATPAVSPGSAGAQGSLVWVALLLLTTLLPVVSPSVSFGQDLNLGKKTFNKVCADCHGKDGRGQGPKAISSGFKPRDLSLGSYKCRCTPSGALPTDEDLLRSIVEGLPGSAMPAHSDLSADESASLVAFVKTFSDRFQDETAASCLELPVPVASSSEFVAEGQHIYRLLSCDSCHGTEGKADGPSADSLVDDWGEPIKVHNFARLRKMKCGSDDEDIYRTLHTGLNGAPMPSYSDTFLFAGDRPPDLDAIGGKYGDTAITELNAYLGSQPKQEALDAMAPASEESLIEHRTWALVHYLKSLLTPDSR